MTLDVGPFTVQGPFGVATPTGMLFSWGYNKNGELGIGTSGAFGNPEYSRYSPVQVGALNSWTTITSSYSEAIAKHSDGSLWTWGRNALGQLGVNDKVPRSSPTQVSNNSISWDQVVGGSDAGMAGVITGPNFRRRAYNWGQVFDPIFQFGYIISPIQQGARTDWTQIIAQEQFFMGIIGGKLYGWGNNDHFQLGLGYASPLVPNISSPTQVGLGNGWLTINKGWGPMTTGLKADRTLWVWGLTPAGTRSVPMLVAPTQTWRTVVTGYSHYLGIDLNGFLWTWGNNGNGQLGQGDTVARTSPVQLGTNTWLMASGGRDHSIAVRSDGTLWTWGNNNYGKLGNGQHGVPNTNPTLYSKSSPIQVGSLTTWIACAAGKYNSFAIRSS